MNNCDDARQRYERIDKPHAWGECFLHLVKGADNRRKVKEAQTQRRTNGGQGGGQGQGNPRTFHQSHLTQVTEEIEEETNKEHAAFNAETDNDQVLAASSASQTSTAPGWTCKIQEQDLWVARQSQDHLQAPAAADACRVCQGDSPFNKNSYAFGNKDCKPALKAFFPQLEQHELDHPHEKRCEGLCLPWKSNAFCHSSFSSPCVQTQCSHHINIVQLQTTSLPSNTKQTFLSQPGMTPSATLTWKEPHLKTLPNQCRKRHPMANKPLSSWRKTCVSIPKEKQLSKKILSKLSRLATLNQTSMLQTAVCNAVTSLDDDMHEHMSQEEKAGTDNKRRSTPNDKANPC
jgi:hypothetical protein